MSNLFSDRNYRDLWDKELDSGNREKSEQNLALKAQELAWVINARDANTDCIDLGCGAGELLRFLSSKINVAQALDFSEGMLERARQSMPDGKMKFIHADPFSFLPKCATPIWLTTGALNQYLDQRRMDELIEIFVRNEEARAFYLFDCVDPLRAETLGLGSSFLLQSEANLLRSFLIKVMSVIRITLFALQTQGTKQVIKFKNRRSGFGYLPQYWLRKSLEMNLDVKILSSANFEYRYHVVLRKGQL